MTADVTRLLKFSADLAKAGVKAQKLGELVVAKTAMDLTGRAQKLAPVRTGNLTNSISAEIDGLHAEVGPAANYGVYVEYGTYKMAPRPYLGPALDAVSPGFYAALEQIPKKAIG